MSKYESADYQNECRKLVDREVYYCVSTLISDLAANDAGDYYDEILSVCMQDDWLEPATDHTCDMTRDECVEELENLCIECDDDESIEKLREAVSANLFDETIDAQEFCERYGLDPYVVEACEHWIVSNWLARKLEAKGEMVSYDIHGLTIWGRRTTGQAIYIDHVICEIYDDMQRAAA